MKKNKKKIIVIVAVILVLLAVIGTAVGLVVKSKNKTDSKPQSSANLTVGGLSKDDTQTDLDEITKTLGQRNVYFAGFDDTTVNADSKVKLPNLEENEDFLMKYQIYEGDTLVYETGLIESGKSVYWTIGDTLSVGEHKLSINQWPYCPAGDDQYIPLTQGNCSVTFTVIQ